MAPAPVYVETPRSDSIYLETADEGAFLELSAFLEDKSRKRFERNNQPAIVAPIVALCLGLMLALVGLFNWRQWTRKRLF